MYNLSEHYPVQLCPSDSGKVLLTIEIESSQVKALCNMLDGLLSFFRTINQKQRVMLATERAASTLNQQTAYFQQYTESVIDTYKILIKQGFSPRSAISETLSTVKNQYPNAYYDSIKEILTKSGTLKKNGFYKKN
jgi:hypothetical protein